MNLGSSPGLLLPAIRQHGHTSDFTLPEFGRIREMERFVTARRSIRHAASAVLGTALVPAGYERRYSVRRLNALVHPTAATGAPSLGFDELRP